LLAPKIIIERLYGDAPRELLIAPRWNLSRAEIVQSMENEMRRRQTYQGRLRTNACAHGLADTRA
jgi:radical SAM superfamily enzyme